MAILEKPSSTTSDLSRPTKKAETARSPKTSSRLRLVFRQASRLAVVLHVPVLVHDPIAPVEADRRIDVLVPPRSSKREARHSFDLRARRVPEVQVSQMRPVELPEPVVYALYVVRVDLRRRRSTVERLLHEMGHRKQDYVREAPSRESVVAYVGHVRKLQHSAHVLAVVEAIVPDRRDFRAKLDELAHGVSSRPVVVRGVSHGADVV